MFQAQELIMIHFAEPLNVRMWNCDESLKHDYLLPKMKWYWTEDFYFFAEIGSWLCFAGMEKRKQEYECKTGALVCNGG